MEKEKLMKSELTSGDPSDLSTQDQIQSRIFTVRGMQIMLDRDLSVLYQVETKVLNQAVKRNIDRFPERFMFRLNQDEWISLRSQFVTIENTHGGRGEHSKYLPYAFSEQGVTQLSAVLKSKVAIEMSIRINDAFHAMRRFIAANAGLFQRIEKVERDLIEYKSNTDNRIEQVIARMDELSPLEPEEQLFPNGCVFDAWKYLSELVRKAKKQIVLIDNYCDDRTLSLLTKRTDGVKTVIHSRYSATFEEDLKKHNTQYPETKVNFVQLPHQEHDRFLIVDDTVYILGDSLKNFGHSLTAVLKTNFTPTEILAKLK